MGLRHLAVRGVFRSVGTFFVRFGLLNGLGGCLYLGLSHSTVICVIFWAIKSEMNVFVWGL